MQLEEQHFQSGFSWPQGYRMAVMLSFDFQGGEGVALLKDGSLDHEAYTQAEYGPQTGIRRILRLLEKLDAKATFLVCGAIAQRYPQAVKAIAAGGHEVAGHGYHHEVARNLSRNEEEGVIRNTTAMLEKTAGTRPVGWRSCTQSPNSIELLMAQGYLWNSNSFAFDLPFMWKGGDRRLIELPRQPFGDGRIYGRRDSGTPADALTIWKSLFDELYKESEDSATFCPFQFHPYISSRPGRAQVLSELIQYMQSHETVWFATGTEIARWCIAK